MKFRYFWVSLGIAVLVVLIIACPILVNRLMFIGDFNVAGSDESWISFYGSFTGAIIGGIIAGALTVYGVYLTIKRQTMIDLQNKFPNILLKGRKATTMMNHFIFLVKGYNETGDQQYKLRNYVEEVIEKRDTLLELSSEISAEAFSDVEGFLQAMVQLDFNFKDARTSDGAGGFAQKNVSLDILNSYSSGTSEAVRNINKIIDDYAKEYYKNRY
jgi:hypothetical protein